MKRLQNKSKVEFPDIQDLKYKASVSAKSLIPVKYKNNQEIYDAIYNSYMNCANMYLDLLELEFGYSNAVSVKDVIELYGLYEDMSKKTIKLALSYIKRHAWNAALEKAIGEVRQGDRADMIRYRIMMMYRK